MAIIGIGVDIVDIERIRRVRADRGNQFLNHIFTLSEQQRAVALAEDVRDRFFAKRFAVKEACAKAFGTGIGSKIGFLDIEVDNDAVGAPMIRLLGKARLLLPDAARIHVSISDDTFATAFVVIESL